MNMYGMALASQSACNLSGLIHSLPKIADEVWDELRASGKDFSTEDFNHHPVMRLFAEQIQWLTSGKDYGKAAEVCESRKGD